ncbi:MAG: hypothetical protein WDN49_23260 [Acetobacteraceae bacterium]
MALTADSVFGSGSGFSSALAVVDGSIVYTPASSRRPWPGRTRSATR